MAANHGLIMSQIEEFLVGNLEAELVDCNRLIQQQADVVEWNVINNVSSRTVAGHIERLERLQSQRVQLLRWQEELLLSEALLNSILRQWHVDCEVWNNISICFSLCWWSSMDCKVPCLLAHVVSCFAISVVWIAKSQHLCHVALMLDCLGLVFVTILLGLY